MCTLHWGSDGQVLLPGTGSGQGWSLSEEMQLRLERQYLQAQ